MEVDVGVFSIGVGTGASIAALWLRDLLNKFVIPCGNANCPHHKSPKPPTPPVEPTT